MEHRCAPINESRLRQPVGFVFGLVLLYLVGFLLSACATGGGAATTSMGSRATGMTADEAAVRLFATAYAFHMEHTAYPGVLEGAGVGQAQPATRDYGLPGPILASWIIDYDPLAARSLFEQMRPLEMSEVLYIVPMVKDGRSADEFDLFLDERGEWRTSWGPLDPLPGGSIHNIEEATANLKGDLGQEAEVRVTLFLPTGLVFAVGRQKDREEAVYLSFVTDGIGHTAKDVRLPDVGQVFTSDQLRALLGQYN